MRALGRTARRLRAGFAVFLFIALGTALAPQDAQAQNPVISFSKTYQHVAQTSTVCPRPETPPPADRVQEGRHLILEVTRSSTGPQTLPVEFEIVNKMGATGRAADLSTNLSTLASITFAANESRRCYSLGIARDLLVEPNEKLVLRIKSKSNYTVSSTQAERTITIEDGDHGGIRMAWREDATLTPGSNEGADVTLYAGAPVGSVSGTISPTNCTWHTDTTFNQRVTIPWRKKTAKQATLADFDYPSAVTFVNGVATVTFKAKADADTEAESFGLEIDNPVLLRDAGIHTKTCETAATATANSLGNFFFFEGTISEPPEPPEKTVSVPSERRRVRENAGNATVTVTASPAFGTSVTFNVAYSGTATGANNPANGDYDNDAVTSVTFNAADTTKDIVIPITDDTVDDDDETIIVTISLASGSTLPDGFTISNASTTVTITDDEDSTVSVPSTLSVTEGTDSTATVTITASKAFGQTTTFDVTYGGTATGANNPANGDYDNDAVTSVTFNAADTTKDIVIPITDDNVDEPAETIIVTITPSAPLPEEFRLVNPTTTVTITDDEDSTVSVPSTLSVTEGTDSNATVTITPSKAFGRTTTFDITYGGTATGANGPANGDYDNDAVTSVTFNAADTTKDIVIPITDDNVDEPAETIIVTITPSAPLPEEFGGGNDAMTTTVTITDDDESPVLADIADETLKLGQMVDITASATDGDNDTITYAWTRKTGENTPAIPGGTALGQAQLMFGPPAVGTYTMTVTASDGYNEDTEEVVILVTEKDVVSVPGTRSVTEGTDNNATITITTTATFGGSGLTFDVTYNDDNDDTATGHAAPANGDYDNDAVTSIAFSASETTKDIVIPITDDDVEEDNETFTVTIALAQGSALPTGFALGNVTTTVTIQDDDEPPVLADIPIAGISVPETLEVTEGTHRNATVTVTASQALGEPVTFDVTYGDGTATGHAAPANGDYDNDAVTSIAFSASETTKDIVIPITDDTVDEDNETFMVAIALPQGSALPAGFALGNATTTVTITDNDATPGVTVSPTALEVDEGSSGRYTLVLDTRPADDVTVTVTGTSGDVTAQPSKLTFTTANWSTAQTVTVAAGEDDDAAADDAVTLTHRASGGGYDAVTIDVVTVTVTEDDEAAVTLSETELVIDEGDQGSYTVVLDTQPVGGEVTVTPASGDRSALEVSGALIFGAANWNVPQAVTVTGVRDADTDDATVTVSHAVSGGDYEEVTASSVTVTVTDKTLAWRIERANRVNTEVLPQVAAATVSHTLSAVTERMEDVFCEARAASVRFGALPSAPLDDEWGLRAHSGPAGPSVSEMLDGSSFTLPLGASGDAGTASSMVSLWGRGERISLSGSESEVSWDGELWSAHLGADWCQRPDLVAGAAVAYSESDLDAGVGDGAQVAHETKIASLNPYMAWLQGDGSNLWGSVGYGSGEVRVAEEENGIRSAALTQDLSQWSVAMGGRSVLLEDMVAGGVTRVAVKGEGALARLDTEANDGLAALAVKTTRLRLLLEGSHERELSNRATLTPALEAGLRHDGGDLGQGFGIEAGASLTWHDPAAGWTGELRARTLAAHEHDRDEWGVSALVRLDPGADGRGTFLTFGPAHGRTESGLGQLFDYSLPPAADGVAAEEAESRLEAEVGHGFGLPGPGPLAVLTPWAGLSLAESGARALRLGARYRMGEALALGIESVHRPETAGTRSLMGRAALRW